MNRHRKDKPFFNGKNCFVCKKTPTVLRFYNGQSYCLCGREECEKNWLLRMQLWKGIYG